MMGIMIPGNIDYLNMIKHTTTLPRELYLESLIGTNHSRAGYEFKVGDHISFCPAVMIDYWTETALPKRIILDHMGLNIYEFHFRPIEEYYQSEQGWCDYLVEILPGFIAYHSSWRHQCELKVGQWYRGYGRLGSCLDPTEFNPLAEPTDIEKLWQKAQIERILVDQTRWEDLVAMGYLHDWPQFRENLRRYRYESREVESNETWENGWLSCCVRLG
jgi:hypothetical protein